MNLKQIKKVNDMAVKHAGAIERRGNSIKEKRETERIQKETAEREAREAAERKKNSLYESLKSQLTKLLNTYREQIIDYMDTRSAIFSTKEDELENAMFAWEDSEIKKMDGGGYIITEWEDENGYYDSPGIIFEPCVFLCPAETGLKEHGDIMLLWYSGTGSDDSGWFDLNTLFEKVPISYIEHQNMYIDDCYDFANKFFADFDTFLEENFPEE